MTAPRCSDPGTRLPKSSLSAGPTPGEPAVTRAQLTTLETHMNGEVTDDDRGCLPLEGQPQALFISPPLHLQLYPPSHKLPLGVSTNRWALPLQKALSTQRDVELKFSGPLT